MVASQIAQASPLDIRRYSHAVADLDGTLVDGRVAQGQGKYFLQDEFKRGHVSHVLLGLTNYGSVKKAAEAGEAEGLDMFGSIIGRTDCARRDRFLGYARRYLNKHSIPGAEDLMLYLSQRMPTFIATIGSDTAAEPAAEFYRCIDWVSNEFQYTRPGVIRGSMATIRDGKDKLEATREMLSKRQLQISDGIIIGNDRYDHDLMEASALAVASPLADEETRDLIRVLKGVVVEDYKSLLDQLEAA